MTYKTSLVVISNIAIETVMAKSITMKIGFAKQVAYQARHDVCSRERISDQHWTATAALLIRCWYVPKDSGR